MRRPGVHGPARAPRRRVGRRPGCLRVFALLALTLVVAALGWAGVVAVDAWLRAPKVAAALAEAGALPFPPESLPAARTCALVAVQDRTFFAHHGLGLLAGPPGHTTITQSIGKWMFFRRYRPGLLHWRKIELMVAALALDRRVSKHDQLRLFLNRTWLGTSGGRDVFGFPAAARTYFRKPVEALTDEEFLRFLALLDAPERYGVLRAPAANAARARQLGAEVRATCAAPAKAPRPSP